MRHLRRLTPAVGLLALSVLATACPPPPPPPAPLVIRDPASLGEANVVGDGDAINGSVSRDGRFVAFKSASTNVRTLPGPIPALYLRDLQTGVVQTVTTVDQFSRISGNGRYVAYTDLTKVSVWDRVTEQTRTFVPSAGTNLRPFVSDHGTTVVWGKSASVFSPSPGDVCSVHDLVSGTDTPCPPPVGAPMIPGAASLLNASRNTRFVVYYWTNWADPSDPFNGPKLWDRSTGTVTDLGAPSTVIAPFLGGGVSDDGRFVTATDTANPTTTPVVLDLVGHTVLQLPVLPNDYAAPQDISSDGRYVAFGTSASNLSPDDTNGTKDVYVWDTTTGSITLASRSPEDGTVLPGNFSSCSWTSGSITDEGHVCVLTIDPMVSLDTNGQYDIYVLPFA